MDSIGYRWTLCCDLLTFYRQVEELEVRAYYKLRNPLSFINGTLRFISAHKMTANDSVTDVKPSRGLPAEFKSCHSGGGGGFSTTWQP